MSIEGRRGIANPLRWIVELRLVPGCRVKAEEPKYFRPPKGSMTPACSSSLGQGVDSKPSSRHGVPL